MTRKVIDETWAVIDGRRVSVAVEGPDDGAANGAMPRDEQEVVARLRLTPAEQELIRKLRAKKRATPRNAKAERAGFERAVGRLAIDLGTAALGWLLDGDAKPEKLDE